MTTDKEMMPRKASDRRGHERIGTALAGKFCLPAMKLILECEVINLSGGGASVICAEPPDLDTPGVLYLEIFGRFECVPLHYKEGLLGLSFVCGEAKRQRLLRDLAAYVNAGLAGVTRQRRDPRNASRCYFNRPGGEVVQCDVLDISLNEVLLRTRSRPPIGEIVNLGRASGQVKRHEADGIAIQFLELVAQADNQADNHASRKASAGR